MHVYFGKIFNGKISLSVFQRRELHILFFCSLYVCIRIFYLDAQIHIPFFLLERSLCADGPVENHLYLKMISLVCLSVCFRVFSFTLLAFNFRKNWPVFTSMTLRCAFIKHLSYRVIYLFIYFTGETQTFYYFTVYCVSKLAILATMTRKRHTEMRVIRLGKPISLKPEPTHISG